MTQYLLTLRPCVEITAIKDGGSISSVPLYVSEPLKTTLGLSSRAYLSTEVDLLRVLGSISSDAFKLVKECSKSISKSKTLSFLLLLSTSGAIVYLLNYKSKPSTQPNSRRHRGSRWRTRDWFWWLLGDESIVEGINNESTMYLREKYIQLQQKKSFPLGKDHHCLHSTKENRRKPPMSLNYDRCNKSSSPDVIHSGSIQIAPCPNCIKGICRIRKHQVFRSVYETANSTENSSLNNSPLHPGQQSMTPNTSNHLPPTSTPESADDEASDIDDLNSAKFTSARAEKFRSRFFKLGSGSKFKCDEIDIINESPLIYKSKNKKCVYKDIYNSSESRVPPIGQEIAISPVVPKCGDINCTDPICSKNKSIYRDESVDSISGVSGSMLNLVKGAREIRRIIREASFDSLTSDLSLEVNENVGCNTEFHFDSLQSEISQLKENCKVIDDRFDSMHVPNELITSKSEYGLSTAPDSLPIHDESRSRSKTPDFSVLQKPPKHFWTMTANNYYSDTDSPNRFNRLENEATASMEWESPFHGWHDLKKTKYKVALSSQASDSGSFIAPSIDDNDAWEWDSEGLESSKLILDNNELLLAHNSMLHHHKWLPEHADQLELDLEVELSSHYSGNLSYLSSANSSRGTSRRNSVDRNYFANRIRLPPSGRSSVDRGSGDTPRQCIDHATLVKSFGVYPCPDKMAKSTCSEESGFQDLVDYNSSNNTSSQFTSSGLTLSPVHEAKEPNGSVTSTPVKGRESAKKCSKRLFLNNENDQLISVIQEKES